MAYPSEDRQTDLETSQAPLDDDSWNKRQKYNTLSVSLLERNLEFGNVVLTFESVGRRLTSYREVTFCGVVYLSIYSNWKSEKGLSDISFGTMQIPYLLE